MSDQSPFYDEHVWIDDDGSNSVGTRFSALRMNHIEVGVGSAHARIDVIELTPGPPGTPGADGDDGQGFTWRGEWDGQGEYFPYDVTEYGGSSWVCIAYTAFGVNPPGAPTEWQLVAASGAVGAQGVQGPAGVGSGAVGGVLAGFLPNPGLASGVASGALSPYFVGVTDPRLSDARTPSGPAGGVLSGLYPNPGLASAVASAALAPYFVGVGSPAQGAVGGPVLAGSLPNPGLASASFASAFASGVGVPPNRRIFVEAATGSANAVHLSFGSAAVAEMYGVESDGSAVWAATALADDTFGADSSASFTARLLTLGDWTWDTANGLLKPNGLGSKTRMLTWNVPGSLFNHGLDSRVQGLSSTDGVRDMWWVVKWVDANNYLYWEYRDGNSDIRLREVRGGGAATTLFTAAGFHGLWSGSTSTYTWQRARINGDVVTFDYWTNTSHAPDVNAPANSQTFTLTGASKTVFGSGIAGLVGFAGLTSASATVFGAFIERIKHFTLNQSQNQLRVRVKASGGSYVDRLLLDGLGRTDLAGTLGL